MCSPRTTLWSVAIGLLLAGSSSAQDFTIPLPNEELPRWMRTPAAGRDFPGVGRARNDRRGVPAPSLPRTAVPRLPNSHAGEGWDDDYAGTPTDIRRVSHGTSSESGEPTYVPPAPSGWSDPGVASDPDALPPLEEELWRHGGSYLYEPEGDRLGWPAEDHDIHYQVLRLPEDWEEPRPLTAFQRFLGNDAIGEWPGLKWFGEQGFQWEPRFVGHGSLETFGLVLEQGDRRTDGIGAQLLLDFDLRLTGTERFHVQFRPLGRKNSGGSFYQFSNPRGYHDNSTGIPDRYWFEGEIQSLFGGLFDDPFPVRDYHFVVGKFPFQMHNSLLMNDDILGFAVNKNTLLLDPFSNINIQGFYALDDVDAIGSSSSELAGVNVVADYRNAFLEFTYAWLDHTQGAGRDAHYLALSGTKFIGAANFAARALFKIGDETGFGDGQLFVLESNLNRRFSHEFEEFTGIEHGVFYANVFHANDGWTSISGGNFNRLRSTFAVNPLTAIAAGRPAVDTTGVALGVQLFRHHEDESFIPEIAYEAPDGEPVLGIGLRYQRKLGRRTYLDIFGIGNFSDDQRFDREGVMVSTVIVF